MNEKKNKPSINDWWIYENHVCEMPNEKWIWKLSSQKIFIYSKRLIHYLTNFIMNQHNDQSTAPVSQRSLVHIPYRPEFSGLIFTTATVVFITAKISFIFKLILKVNQQEKIKIPRSLVYWRPSRAISSQSFELSALLSKSYWKSKLNKRLTDSFTFAFAAGKSTPSL